MKQEQKFNTADKWNIGQGDLHFVSVRESTST